MTKNKNKDGIELNYKGNDSHKVLVKEVITEAIKILTTYNRFDGRSTEYALHRGVNFLKDNFDLWEDDYPYNTEFGDGRTEEEMEAIVFWLAKLEVRLTTLLMEQIIQLAQPLAQVVQFQEQEQVMFYMREQELQQVLLH